MFFIIRSGNVRITKDLPNGDEEEVARFSKGEYFGEIALIKEDVRSANVYAVGVVQCYTLDRTAFTNLVGMREFNHPPTLVSLTIMPDEVTEWFSNPILQTCAAKNEVISVFSLSSPSVILDWTNQEFVQSISYFQYIVLCQYGRSEH